MSLRITKRLGYAIYPEQGEASAALFARIKEGIDLDGPTPAWQTLQDYNAKAHAFYVDKLGRDRFFSTLSETETEGVDVSDAFLYHEQEEEDAATSDIFLLTPPQVVSEWKRYDNIMDYMEAAAEKSEDGVFSKITPLPFNIFPLSHSGWKDKEDGRVFTTADIGGFVWAVAEHTKGDYYLFSHKKMDALAKHHGYQDIEEAKSRIIKMPPAEIRYMASLTPFFNNDAEVALLQPVSYTAWQ